MIPHVVHVLPYLEIGGTERHVLSLISALRGLGLCTGEVLAPSGPFSAILKENDIPWFAFDSAQSGLLRHTRSFRRQLAERLDHVSLVHVHASPDLLFMASRGHKPRRPRVLTVHGFHGRGGPVSYRLAAASANRFASALISVSESEKNLLLAGGAKAGKLHRVYNGVADPGKPNFANGGSTPVRIAFVGRLSPVKGIDVLLSAFARMAKALGGRITVKLDIMGTGPQMDQLRRLAAELDLDENVRFLGYVPDAATRLAEYDIFCLPSREDMCPLVCVEAMAQGKPVVATDVGGLPELVLPGESGILVSVEDEEGLSAALQQLVEDPDLRVRMGRQARHFYEKSFTQEVMARQTFKIYEDIGVYGA